MLILDRDSIFFGLRSFSRTTLLGLVLISFALCFVFNTDSTQGVFFYIAASVALLVACLVFILPLRILVAPFAIILLIMPDLTQSVEQVEAVGLTVSASLWQIPVGSLSPSVAVLLGLAFATLRMAYSCNFRPHKIAFVYFFGVSIIMSVLFGYSSDSLSRFAADFKIALFLYLSIILFETYFRKFPDEILRVIQLFFMFFIGAVLFESGKQLIPSIQLGPDTSYVNLSMDSGKGLILAVTFFALSRIGRQSNVILWFGVSAFTVYLLIGYQTRWLIVTLFVGLICVYQIYPLRLKIRFLTYVIPSILIGCVFFSYFEFEALRIMMLRFSFVQQLSLDVVGSEIEVVRVGSIINALNLLWEKNGFLIGMGYGSWYSADYFPMPNLTVGAFDNQSLESGKYYRVHDFGFHFLFKFGVLGLAIYLWLFISPLKKLWEIRSDILQKRGGSELLFVMFGLAPTVITYMWFTGKGNIFCGFYIAICISLVIHIRKLLVINCSLNHHSIAAEN